MPSRPRFSVDPKLVVFYYLRVVVAMFMQAEPAPMAHVVTRRVPITAGVTLDALAVLLVRIGVYPAPFIALARSALS